MATIPRKHGRRTAAPPSAGVSFSSDRLSLRVPDSAFTLAGFRTWVTANDFPENVRAAFIDQEVYLDMSNEELETHVLVKGEVSRVLMTLNRALKLGKFYPDGALVTNEDAQVSNNPDATFVTWEGLEAGRARLVPREGERGQFVEIEGTPDWVLEVVSDSSVEKDTQRLRAAYHRAGIPEYWVVDARGEDIVFQILLHRQGGYAAVPVRAGWQRSRVFARRFRLVRERDRGGLWEYTLEVRER